MCYLVVGSAEEIFSLFLVGYIMGIMSEDGMGEGRTENVKEKGDDLEEEGESRGRRAKYCTLTTTATLWMLFKRTVTCFHSFSQFPFLSSFLVLLEYLLFFLFDGR